MFVFAVTKFHDGAWIIILLVPTLVAIFFAIHHHYRHLARDLSLEHYSSAPQNSSRHRVILLVGGVHRGTLEALHYARSLSDDVTAVHVSIEAAEAEKVRSKWLSWGNGVRLVILESPYRLLIEPILEYVNRLSEQGQFTGLITIVVPQFVPKQQWHNLLHTQTALLLRLALLFKRGVVVIDVPYHVE